MVSPSISHYRVQKKLGEGGMGEVYLALDTRLQRQVALKVLPPQVARDEVRVRRFMQEARAASALNHPNILTVYDIGEGETSPYIATELVQGETLRNRLRSAPLSWHESLDIASQVASALDAAHGAGIIHRDIKPENLMVRPDGLVKVLDFGLAKLLAPITSESDSQAETLARGLTRPGSIVGTLHYMSPEQVRAQPLDARADLFSLGAVLYEMLTGAGPFDKPTQGDVIAAILTETPPLDDLPTPLQPVVARSLQKAKEKRYQTAAELLLDLKRLSRELELTDHPLGVSPQTREVAAHATGTFTARRFSLLHGLAILLVVGLALAAVWWFALRRNVPQPASLKTTEVATWRSAPGEIYSVGSFSPDGTRVAFVKKDGSARNIYFKPTTADAKEVSTTKDEFDNNQPIWSPDGQEIAYFSTRGNQEGLWRVPYVGSSPTLIAIVPASDTKPRYWSSSGKLYYEAGQNLFAFDLKLGQTTQLTSFDRASAAAHSLNLSPDEHEIVYLTEGERWGIWTMPAHGGASRQIVNSATEVRNLVWHADSQRILYSALVDGVFQIFVTDTSGSTPTQITFGDKDRLVLDVAAGGAQILYGSSKEESDVWGVNIAQGKEFALTSDINSELWPSVAPDNKLVAFSSVKNLSQGDKLASGTIMIQSTETDAPPASPLVANGFMPVWSPDGKRVAFVRLVGETRDIWTINALGGEARRLTSGGVLPFQYSVLPYNRTQTRDFGWSPNSNQIVYGSQKSGAPNLWLVAADGASETRLTDNEEAGTLFYSPLWSADGKRLIYGSSANQAGAGKTINRIWMSDVETKTARAVFQAETFLRLLGWSEDRQGLIVATSDKASGAPLAEIRIVEISTVTGEPRLLRKLQSAYLYNIHLSADGQTLAYVAQPDGGDNLYLMPVRGGTARRLTANTDTRLYLSSLAWSPDGKAIYFGKQSRFSLLAMITNLK